MEYDVVGREIHGQFVLFGLGDGVYATVNQAGEVRLSVGWAPMTRFVTIDTRGNDAVPAEELRSAIQALKKMKKSDIDEWKATAKDQEEEVAFYERSQKDYMQMVEKMPRDADGSIRWSN